MNSAGQNVLGADMWEHQDQNKRYTSKKGIIGFWRECIFCGEGSTDIYPAPLIDEPGDPNYMIMIRIKPIAKKFRYLMKGTVFDKYWVICESCDRDPRFTEALGRKRGKVKA